MWLDVSAVCAFWRRVALGTSELWNRLDLRQPRTAMELCTTRNPQRLCLTYTRRRYIRKPGHPTLEDQLSWFINMPATSISEISIYRKGERLGNSFAHFGGTASHLSAITITDYGLEGLESTLEPQAEAHILSLNVPNLRKLCLRPVSHSVWQSPLLRTQNLSYISLNLTGPSEDILDVARAVTQFPALQSLRLTGSVLGHAFQQYIYHLVTPNLQELDIWPVAYSMWKSPLICSNNLAVIDMHLEEPAGDVFDLIHALNQSPALQRLCLKGCLPESPVDELAVISQKMAHLSRLDTFYIKGSAIGVISILRLLSLDPYPSILRISLYCGLGEAQYSLLVWKIVQSWISPGGMSLRAGSGICSMDLGDPRPLTYQIAQYPQSMFFKYHPDEEHFVQAILENVEFRSLCALVTSLKIPEPHSRGSPVDWEPIITNCTSVHTLVLMGNAAERFLEAMCDARLKNGHTNVFPNLNALIIERAKYFGTWPELCFEEVASRRKGANCHVAVLAKLEFRHCGDIAEEDLELFKEEVAEVIVVPG